MPEKPLELVKKWAKSHQQREAHLHCAAELEAALRPLKELVEWMRLYGAEFPGREMWIVKANELARALGMEEER